MQYPEKVYSTKKDKHQQSIIFRCCVLETLFQIFSVVHGCLTIIYKHSGYSNLSDIARLNTNKIPLLQGHTPCSLEKTRDLLNFNTCFEVENCTFFFWK